MNPTLYNDDCLKTLKTLPDNHVDSVITDPPYAINFMSKKWDYQLPSIDIWKEALRVSKPGSIALIFGGTRTYHRLTCSIEDAGFEIMDCIAWTYGKGMPKGLNIGKSIKNNPEQSERWMGWITTLKPSWEPIVIAMKPVEKTYTDNALKYGVAGFNIDECRIPLQKEGEDKRLGGNGTWKTDKADKKVYAAGYEGIDIGSSSKGRFPSNFIMSHHPECQLKDEKYSCHSDCPIKIMNDQSGKLKSGDNCIRSKTGTFLEHGGLGKAGDIQTTYGDKGGAARFFYCTKAAIDERYFFCSICKDVFLSEEENKHYHNSDNSEKKNNIIYHPTIKPVNLMRYLCKLTKTPDGGTVLDPFMGTGSTGVACVEIKRDFIGMEIEESYFSIAKRRIDLALENRGNLFE